MSKETPQFIMDFVKEISDSPDLYLSFFNERQALMDATRVMREQKSELATLRRELAVAQRALRHRTCFSSICDASECVEDSGGPDEQCAYRRELTQAAAQMEKEAGNGQD